MRGRKPLRGGEQATVILLASSTAKGSDWANWGARFEKALCLNAQQRVKIMVRCGTLT